MARTDPDEQGRRRHLGLHRRARARPASTLGKPDKKMGQRAPTPATSSSRIAACRPTRCIGGSEGEGFKTAMKVLDRGRLHIAARLRRRRRAADLRMRALCHGARAVRPADRRVPARPGDARRQPTEAYAARCMVLDAAQQARRRRDVAIEAPCCKYFASRDGAAASPTAPCRSSAARATSPIRHRALLSRRAPLPHLRGHQPDPATRHRPQHAARRRVSRRYTRPGARPWNA